MVNWCGLEFDVVATITAGEWYRSLFEVVAPQYAFVESGDVRLSYGATDAAYAFCAPLLAYNGNEVDRTVLARASQLYNASRPDTEKEFVFPHLYERVVEACAWAQHADGLSAYYGVTYRSDEYDPKLDTDRPCECEECCDRVAIDDDCLFRQPPITPFSRMLGAVDVELVRQFWDLPYYAYQHARVVALHRGLRTAAITQERKRAEAAEDEKRRRRDMRTSAHAMIRAKHGARYG